MTAEIAIKNVLDKVQSAYATCWQVLAGMRKPQVSPTFGADLLRFQPTLAQALYDLNQLYLDFGRQRADLVCRKLTMPTALFLAEIKQLGRYQEALKEATYFGKTLGDAFAWFFYRRDLGHLRSHLEHKPITEIPTGTGQIGEFEFIRNLPIIDEHFVLYHGVTTILRHGDISLVDLNTFRPTALGELKSQRIGPGKVTITVHLVGPKDRPFPATIRNAPRGAMPPGKLPPDLIERLQRQIQGMAESFEPRISNDSVELHTKHHFASLVKVVREATESKAAFEKCGDGLLLTAFRIDEYKTLFEKLLGPPFDTASRVQGVDKFVRGLIDQSQPQGPNNANRLDIGRVGATTLPGMTPLCWCPIDLGTIERIILKDVVVTTVYNPAHFARKLREKGFIVQPATRGEYKVSKRVGDLVMSLQGLDYFQRLVREHLIDEDAVVQTICQMDDLVASGKAGSRAKISLEFSERFQF
jgi:hypothetical protein